MVITKKKVAIAAGGAAIVAVAVLGASHLVAFPAFAGDDGVKATLAKEFPKSQISSVDCNMPWKNVCEVTIGKNAFYTSKDGHYLMVGSMLDMIKKRDMTDDRLKELAAMDTATSKITGDGPIQAVGAVPGSGAGNVQQMPSQATLTHLDVNLPATNAVVHNPGAPIKLKVFSDYNCHWCRSMFTELASNNNIEVTEYPIGLLAPDSAMKAKLVLCADDRIAASEKAFQGGQINVPQNCKKAEDAVEKNTEFARANGITGTPTIIRADGTVNTGYLPPDRLVAFGSAKS